MTSVTCQVSTSTGKRTAYSISDPNGQLSVNANPNDDLEFSLMGYEKKKIRANDCSTTKVNNIELNPQAVLLREVRIKAPAIRSKSDTLIYHVASFAKAGDRHLEDVLKKLPGIKVAENGTVSYQGKAINKFYIEGEDLMGNSYNQATRNMPVDAVADVEVLENHQPVKMLKDKQFSDHAALNIKLNKNYQSRPFGEAEGGIGSSKTWDNRIFLTQILGRSQLLVSGKMNNIGADLSDETKEHIDITDLDAYEPLMHSLLSVDLGNEDLPQERYLYNHSYSLGINYLTGISKDATFRSNVLFYDDHSTYNNNLENHYGGPTNVDISENNRKDKKTVIVIPILRYELNSSKTFISNELRYSFEKTTSGSSIETDGAKVQEDISSRPSYLQNYLNTAFSVGDITLEGKSLIRYFDRRETLHSASDSCAYNDAEAYVEKSFAAKNILSTTLPLFHQDLNMGVKMYYSNQLYDFNGNMRHQDLQLSYEPSYYIKYRYNGRLSIDLPLTWSHTVLSSSTIKDKSRSFFAFSPGISLRQLLADKFTFVLSANTSTYSASPDFYSLYPLRQNYRTLYHPSNELFKNRDYRLSLLINYKNLAEMFFSNLSIAYSSEKRESYENDDYTNTYNEITELKGINHRKVFMVDVSADKTFTDAGVSLKTELTYNHDQYLLSQSSVQTFNHSHILSAQINTSFQKFNWIRISFDAKGNLYWEKNQLYHSDHLSSLETNYFLSLFPTKKLEIKFTYQNLTNEISQSHYKTIGLMDINSHYTINKLWEIGVSVSNLLNTRSYTITQASGFNTYSSSLPLRGREAMLHLLLRI